MQNISIDLEFKALFGEQRRGVRQRVEVLCKVSQASRPLQGGDCAFTNFVTPLEGPAHSIRLHAGLFAAHL